MKTGPSSISHWPKWKLTILCTSKLHPVASLVALWRPNLKAYNAALLWTAIGGDSECAASRQVCLAPSGGLCRPKWNQCSPLPLACIGSSQPGKWYHHFFTPHMYLVFWAFAKTGRLSRPSSAIAFCVTMCCLFSQWERILTKELVSERHGHQIKDDSDSTFSAVHTGSSQKPLRTCSKRIPGLWSEISQDCDLRNRTSPC